MGTIMERMYLRFLPIPFYISHWLFTSMSALRILGILDSVVVLVVLFYLAELVPWNAVLGCIVFLASKTVIFPTDLASIIDGIVAIVLVLLLFDVQNTVVLGISLLFLVQKAVRSLT